MSHTPGPWTIKERNDGAGQVMRAVARRTTPTITTNATEVVTPVLGWQYIRADDARLIAAAPDLLAALEASWPGIVGDDAAYDRPIQEVHEQVRAAIAKARETG